MRNGRVKKWLNERWIYGRGTVSTNTTTSMNELWTRTKRLREFGSFVEKTRVSKENQQDDSSGGINLPLLCEKKDV